MPLVLPTRPASCSSSMLFSKIVPNCKKLGLLDRNDGWLRRRFEEIGVIQFEDWADTGEEYTAFALDAERGRRAAERLTSRGRRPLRSVAMARRVRPVLPGPPRPAGQGLRQVRAHGRADGAARWPTSRSSCRQLQHDELAQFREARDLWQLIAVRARAEHAEALARRVTPAARAPTSCREPYAAFLAAQRDASRSCAATGSCKRRQPRTTTPTPPTTPRSSAGSIDVDAAAAAGRAPSFADVLDRFGPYGPRLGDGAPARCRPANTHLFTGVDVRLVPHVWIELHEDLILTLGIDRAAGRIVLMARFGPVLTAMVTPFDDDGALDLDGARDPGPLAAVAGQRRPGRRRHHRRGADAHRRRAAERCGAAVVEAVTVPVIAGTGTNDTAPLRAPHRTRRPKLGVAGILARRARTTTARRRPASRPTSGRSPRATDLPVVVYDIPIRTGRKIATATAAAPGPRGAEHRRR